MLEYGKYDVSGDQTMEQCAITQIEHVKHLQPKLTEYKTIEYAIAYHSYLKKSYLHKVK